MKVYELLEKEEIAVLRKEIDSFANEILQPYVNNLGNQFVNSEEKEIFDPIWGPVAFNAGEIAILDSPLLQRLRRIKQLGLASYVYCDADYSRFAHTIGVFWLAGEMAEIIAKRLSQNDTNEHRKFVQIVRLAALFHDTGHMYYSHVAEHYFAENENSSTYQMVKKAINVFSKKIDDKVSLHEMISVMLVNSPIVRKFLKNIAPSLNDLGIKNSDDVTEITEYISCLILGQANDAELLPYCQIINGPIDADKCDYLSRDSHATNVPVAVDIYRLIHKLNVDKGNLPEGLFPDTKLWEGNKNEEMFYPTIKSSAVEALNQLFMARSIMYNSVYYHQKVRTAETMFRKVLEELDSLGVPAVSNFSQVMAATDDMFGNYCYDILHGSVSNTKQLQVVTEKLKKINARCLLKRACSIDSENIRIVNNDEETGYYFGRDVFMPSDTNVIKELEEETKRQYEGICKVLNVDESFDRSFMIMDFPKVSLSDSIPDIIVSFGNGNTKKYSEIFQTGTWIESKESRRREYYLVTDCEYRELAFLALQKALFCKYGVCLEDRAAICSKVNNEKIKQRKRRLLGKGFYDSALMLVSDIIMPDYERKITEICQKYQTYQGKDGIIITKERVKSFLEQFLQIEMKEDESRSLLEGILHILLQGTYINRKSFAQSMEKVFKCFGDASNVLHVCPLGGLRDSGVHLSYYLNDLDEDEIKIRMHDSLQKALQDSAEGDHIIFYDDGAYSGKQVSGIFEEYMNIPLEERSVKEHHVSPLNEEEIAQLKERKLGIAYMCFNAENRRTVINAAQKAGVTISKIEYMYDMTEKVLESEKGYLKETTQRNLVKKWLNEIGVQLLKSVKKEGEAYKEGWSEERAVQGALGYNDAQQFVIVEASVPTYTLTAFWLENGMFKEKLWIPLFVRTDKPVVEHGQ